MKQKNKPALLIIDIQKGFDDSSFWGKERNNPDAENHAGKLLEHWRSNNFPVFHMQHASTNPDSPLAEKNPGHDFKDEVRPLVHEVILKKSVNSAFIGTDLQKRLEDAGITQIVIAGLTTDHCVSTTARMAGNFGFETYVVSDATATFGKTGLDNKAYSAELVHQISLATLHNEFAHIKTRQEVLELFRD